MYHLSATLLSGIHSQLIALLRTKFIPQNNYFCTRQLLQVIKKTRWTEKRIKTSNLQKLDTVSFFYLQKMVEKEMYLHNNTLSSNYCLIGLLHARFTVLKSSTTLHAWRSKVRIVSITLFPFLLIGKMVLQLDSSFVN